MLKTSGISLLKPYLALSPMLKVDHIQIILFSIKICFDASLGKVRLSKG